MNKLAAKISFFSYFKSRFWLWIFNKTPNHPTFDGLRCKLLKLVGFNIINVVKVFSPLEISPKTNPKNILLKGFIFINSGARFSVPADAKLEINKNTLIGPNVNFETVNHGLHYIQDKPRKAILGNIIIQEGVWIGANTLILQNVHIGYGSVIAGGSVVSKSVESQTVVGGVPAKFIKKIL